MKVVVLLSLSLSFLLGLPGFAQDTSVPTAGDQPAATSAQDAGKPTESEESKTAALAKAAQNPVANLISVPLQNNTAFAIGPYNRTQDVLNVQPVIPVKLNAEWNVIMRIIQPIVWQPYPNQNTGGEYGLGDMNPTFFFSPAKPHKLIWGVGQIG